MKEKPLIMSLESMRLWLDGKKCMTRRLANNPDKPPYKVGDSLWFREPWMTTSKYDRLPPSKLNDESIDVLYLADKKMKEQRAVRFWWGKYRHARFLPHKFARPERPKVLEIRLEHIQDITHEDCMMEGIVEDKMFGLYYSPICPKRRYKQPKSAYQEWIDYFHPNTWLKNDLVWVIKFQGRNEV